MHTIQNKWVFSILLFLPCYFIAQKNDSLYFYNTALKKKAIEYKNEPYLNKAFRFFLMGNADSTLVYTMKQLNGKGVSKERQDYCHYFRGIMFKNKRFFKQAKWEFSQVSFSFHFHYLIMVFTGEIALEQNEYQKALSYFETVGRNKNKGYKFIKSAVYHNIGLCYFHTKQYDKAEFYLFKAAKLQEIEKNDLNLIGSYTDIANLYYEQYKDKQAIPYFQKAYQLSKSIKSVELKQNAAFNMAVVEENRKNMGQALIYRKEYEIWKDSLNNQNTVWSIAEMEKKYTIKQKQKEIDLLETENKLKKHERNGFLLVAILLLALLSTGVYFYRQKIKNSKIILSQKEKLDVLNTAKDKLFSIISHDLRSTVNALKTSNTKLLGNLESKNYNELDKLLHTNSALTNGAYTLLDNLLNWAILQTEQAYFYKEAHRLHAIVEQVVYNFKPLMLDKNIQCKNTVPSDAVVFVDLDSIKIILRNVLDNAIKFSGENDSIFIYSQLDLDGFCNLIIEDTGAGMSTEVRDGIINNAFFVSKIEHNENRGTGLGMQLCQTLIKKNGGILNIESNLNKGTKIILSLPVNM